MLAVKLRAPQFIKPYVTTLSSRSTCIDSEAVDFRKNINRLAALVEQTLGLASFARTVS